MNLISLKQQVERRGERWATANQYEARLGLTQSCLMLIYSQSSKSKQTRKSSQLTRRRTDYTRGTQVSFLWRWSIPISSKEVFLLTSGCLEIDRVLASIIRLFLRSSRANSTVSKVLQMWQRPLGTRKITRPAERCLTVWTSITMATTFLTLLMVWNQLLLIANMVLVKALRAAKLHKAISIALNCRARSQLMATSLHTQASNPFIWGEYQILVMVQIPKSLYESRIASDDWL